MPAAWLAGRWQFDRDGQAASSRTPIDRWAGCGCAAVARTLPGCSGAGRQLHGGNGGGAVSDTGKCRRIGQRAAVGMLLGTACSSSTGHEQRRESRVTDSKRLGGQRRAQVGRGVGGDGGAGSGGGVVVVANKFISSNQCTDGWRMQVWRPGQIADDWRWRERLKTWQARAPVWQQQHPSTAFFASFTQSGVSSAFPLARFPLQLLFPSRCLSRDMLQSHYMGFFRFCCAIFD